MSGMTHKEERFFNIAREVSYLSNFKQTSVGAVVISGNRILSSACNSQKTRPLQHRYNIYRNFDDYQNSIAREHAEVAALSPLIGKDIEWDKVSVYVYREHKNGERACSRPCPACARLIRDLGIKTVYYLNEDGNYVKEKII